MSKTLLLYAPRDIRYEERPTPDLGPKDVRVRTRLGAISAGTESAWYFGTDPQLESGFRAGAIGQAKFPRMLGYEKCAEVIETGKHVSSFQPGQRVVGHYGHTEEWVVPADRLVPVPDGISDKEAVACSLGTVVLHSIRRSRLQIGEDVLITGLGFIGQLTVKIARFAGASRLAVSDPFESRRELALELGADRALNPKIENVGDTLRGLGEEYDVAFETSSSFDALNDAMCALRRGGRVCVVSQLKGDYAKHPTFGIEFHLQELEMISSDGRGDLQRLARWFFGAIERGAIQDIDRLFTHSVPFEEIEKGFDLMEKTPEDVLKVLVTYE